MRTRTVLPLAATVLLAAPLYAQTTPLRDCPANTVAAAGQVVDSTGAVVANAEVEIDGKAGPAGPVKTDRRGRFTTACLTPTLHTFTATFPSFDPVTLQSTPGSAALLFRMQPSAVVATVDVSGVDPLSNDDIAGAKTLQQADLRQLADDPDEFARQLQVLAASAGGSPGQALITVDGFQNAGTIPPKSAIAYIRINPDLFAAEYEHPPYEGGRIEIYTKPGQSRLHGALFTTQSAAFMNARDPFSSSKAAIGKQRYGFELSGPIQANKSDFAVALEHRQISNFAVVNASVPNAQGIYSPVVYNVATPQSLYVGSVRIGILPTPKNNLTINYSANVNTLGNLGVGGTSLIETGLSSLAADHELRISNLQTISPALLHETRLGYTWNYATDTPNSFAPSLAVAGAFTGGGTGAGALLQHRRDLEFDDDVLFSRGKHNLQAGIQLLDIDHHDRLPTNFNGQYTFGGGTAPSLTGTGTQVISGAEQYRRALLGLPGGTPTSYAATTGRQNIYVNQLRVNLFAQDQYKVNAKLALAFGLRWAMQTAPTTIGNAGPRVGLSYSPDRKQKIVFHLRSGLFFDTIIVARPLENERLNGTNQTQFITYTPTYNAGQPATNGSATITTLRAPFSHLNQQPSLQSHFGVEYEAPRHFHVQANFYLARSWNDLRSENINAPIPVAGLMASPTGPRPLAPNLNLYQFQQSGQLSGNVIFLGLDQHSLKRLQLFVGYVREGIRSDSDNGAFFPQSSYSDAGEFARQSGSPTHQVFSFATYHLPRKIDLSLQFNASSGAAYNVTTGFDNNGDGVFNDRPTRATAADIASGATIYNTRFGALVTSGTGAPISRNQGTLPWNVHMDLNLSHTFLLTHPRNGDGRSLAANLRSTNALNHTNVTAVGSVLGSPNFAIPYQADAGRRVEAGLRYQF